MANVIVCGYLLRYPVAGMAFAYFHYVLGLHRLGHRVAYLEESGWPQSCYDPHRRSYSDDPQAGFLDPALKVAQLDLQLSQFLLVRGSFHGRGSDKDRRLRRP